MDIDDRYKRPATSNHDEDTQSSRAKRQGTQAKRVKRKSVEESAGAGGSTSSARPVKPTKPKPRQESGGGDGESSSRLQQIADAVNQHSRMLTRHQLEFQQLQKENQLVFEIGPELSDLREDICFAAEQWIEHRPEKGSHPDGDLHRILIGIVFSAMRALVSPSDDLEQSDCRVFWQTHLETIRKDKGYVTAFHPFGKKRSSKPPQGNWYWVFRTVPRNSDIRVIDDLLFTKGLGELCKGLTLRRDRGTFDDLARQVAATRL